MPANDLESPKTVKTSEVARTSVRRRVGRSIVRDKRLLTGLLLVGFTAGVVLLGRSVAPTGARSSWIFPSRLRAVITCWALTCWAATSSAACFQAEPPWW